MAESNVKRKVTVRPESPLKPIQPPPLSSLSTRPKAKVNSSAQIRRTAPSRPGTSEGPTPRANSPAKFISSRPVSPTKPPPPRVKSTDSLSPAFQPKLRVTPTTRKNHAVSTPTTPESRNRAHTSASSDVGRIAPVAQQRARHGSVSLHHAISFSSFQNTGRSPSPLNQSDTEQTGRYSPSPPVRIKSKVTSLAKASSPDSLSPTSASQPAILLTRSHKRVSSTSSSISHTTSAPNLPSQSQQTPPTFYPITTASPAANPHRYITRSPPQFSSHHYHHSFQPDSVLPSRQNGFGGVHKADEHATAPLPPNSPPASAVSFSSRSSVSRSSVSASLTAGSSESLPTSAMADHNERNSNLVPQGNGQVTESFLPLRDGRHVDRELVRDEDGDGESRKVRAEAKSNRKIADLEITNRSLLAINASLESVKHRQAKEIRELRRKLRESRLILPPRAYRAVVEQRDALDDQVASASEDDEDDDGGDGGGDETYKRVKVLLEGLLESGQRALERKPADLVDGVTRVTVLNAEEVRSWQDSAGQGGGGSGETEEAAKEVDPFSPSLVALPDDGSSFDSEDEVEMSLIIPSSSTFTPPVLVTDSH